jgi:hypothetical protein
MCRYAFPKFSEKSSFLYFEPTCHEFVDPYVEHDELTVLLDLILLKRGVYRHLLFNRGAEPRRLSGKSTDKALREVSRPSKERLDRWVLLLKLGTTLIALDACKLWNLSE